MDHIQDAADRAEQRAQRSRQRLTEGMEDVTELSQEMADAGLISQENADDQQHPDNGMSGGAMPREECGWTPIYAELI